MVDDDALRDPHDDALTDAAIARVRRWLAQSPARRDPSAELLAGLLQDPDGLQFAIDFVDRVVRPEDPLASAKAFRKLARRPPAFLDGYLRAAVRLGGTTATLLPGIVVPAAKYAMRQLVRHLIIDARPSRLGRHLRRLRRRGVQVNINLLGEAVLGRREADRRFAGTKALLERPDVEYVSIKVSSVAPQLNLWAFEETVVDVVDRLAPLFGIAQAQGKFINLDMEEYHDLDLTLEVFERLMTRFPTLHSGIVLQTYLPDALGAYQRLVEFARARVAAGGATIKIRVVKGANLPMERVDAALHGWPLATYDEKVATDANYKRVLRHALRPENTAAVRVGVAGHNLFDLAHTIELARALGTSDALDVEMLLGMAEEHLDAVRADVGNVVLYTPVVDPRDFDAAVAYLIRRLEENGADENFMSNIFQLDDDEVFDVERRRFLASLQLMREQDEVGPPQPHRTQDRRRRHTSGMDHFGNEPDTDPSLAGNREWMREITQRIPHSTLGQRLVEESRPDSEEMGRIIEETVAAGPGWAALGAGERRRILYSAAEELGRRRGDLLEVMANETGKPMSEGDVEVSEAIDFCRYYADQALELEDVDGATARPVGLTVVVPPWNFPTAIPTGGMTAALATGSPVIIKPAPQARRTAAVIVEALWEAGVPRNVLRLVVLDEDDVARSLITDERVGRLILTGSSETAALFSRWRPELAITAETSGKNAIIVTPDADLDLAANDLVRSAFSHAGQKCSASSLGILVGSIGRSERFLRQLLDAATTLQVGWPDDPRIHVGPVIEPVSGKLERALTELGEGESWLLEPRKLDDSGRLWSPAIRQGVQPGSYTHLTEFFGPHLSLIAVDTLDEAIEVANGTDFGLTAGIHSLDERQVARWMERIQAGNLYVNRGITGAIVRRQPFGGWKLSQVGPGAKAGGPNYLLGLVDWEPAEGSFDGDLPPAEDVSALGVERNVFRHLPSDETLIRLAESGSRDDLDRVVRAAERAGAKMRVSTPEDVSDAEFHARIRSGAIHDDGRVARIRLVGDDAGLAEALAGDVTVAVYRQPVTYSMRLEMLPFLKEQAVTVTAHRYGNPDPRFVDLEI